MTQQTFSSKDMDINLNLESDSNSNSIIHSPRFAEDPTLNYSGDPDIEIARVQGHYLMILMKIIFSFLLILAT